MSKKILLLLWKNLLLRKRHFIVTAFEIILPTFMACILAYTKTKFDSSGAGRTAIGQTFPAMSEAALSFEFRLAFTCNPCVIAYTPDDPKTTEVIDKLSRSAFQTSSSYPVIEFKPFSSERGIEEHLADITFDTTAIQQFRGAIVFENGLDLGNSSRSGTISYKIRLANAVTKTNALFPSLQKPGPDKENARLYPSSGFSYLQLCIDRVLARKLTGITFSHNISLQPFPYPPYIVNAKFNKLYYNILPQSIVIGFVFMVPAIAKGVVSEKETGIRELLKLNGVRGWMQWLGWMLNSMLFLAISVTICVIVLFSNFGSGALIAYGDPTVWWVVLMLYVMTGSAFCFFTCSFFNKPSLAITVGIILWFALYDFPVKELTKVYGTTSVTTKMAYALLPNVAFYLASRAMTAFEGNAKGARWTNIWEPISSTDSLTLGHMILMLLVDTVLYMSLTVYLENVLPSEFGVRKPWYYIFKLNTYININTKPIESNVVGPADVETNKAPGFEAELSNAEVGVKTQNLRKNFGDKKIAVDGVTLKMYAGEIFALLGHNGAGKTTTISMLTGMFAPSGGTATVNGYDITTDLERARGSLGLCPQHNMLFAKLTCSEHLRFFGQLKGLNCSAANEEANQLLHKLQLYDKKNTLSMALSGGQKRKLSLGIALIGGNKVVILDEPTSGMDPEARRAIWDLLLEMRGQRTILLTTHFMEEADVLGDRIGIMASGKLQCCGSSMFLKKFYGAGYTLKLTVSKDGNQEGILNLIQKTIPDAQVKAAHFGSTVGAFSELQITLPTESASTSVLSQMFTELTQQKEHLGIQTAGLSLTTMDEVFLRVGELTSHGHAIAIPITTKTVPSEHDPQKSVIGAVSEKDMSLHSNHKSLSVAVEGEKEDPKEPKEEGPKEPKEGGLKQKEPRLAGLKLATGQFIALLIKKYIYTYRKWKLIIVQLIIPSLLLIAAIKSSSSLLEAPEPPPPLKISVNSYNNLVTLASSSDPAISSQYASVIGSSYKPVSSGTTLDSALLSVGESTLADYREKYVVAFDSSPTSFNAMFNTIPIHAAPLALNLASNILLKNLDPSRDLTIHVTNHPLQSKIISFIFAASSDSEFTLTIPLLFGIFMPIGLGLFAASFIVFPIEEKMCQAKQLQTMTGVSPFTYWISAFTWDYFLVFIVVCVMITCFPIFQTYGIFTSYGGAGVAFLILMIYGFSGIWLSYLLSLYSKTIAGGFALVSIIHIVSGVVFGFVVFIMEILGEDWLDIVAKFRWPGRLFPTFGATMSTMRYTEIASKNGRCNLLSDEAKEFLCDAKYFFLPPKLRDCCANCAQLHVPCFKPITYISWDYKREYRPDPASNVTILDLPGIGQEFVYMIIMAFVYLTMLMMLEYHIFQRSFSAIFRRKLAVFADTVSDEDVMAEVNRVTEMVKSGNINEDALVVENLCKRFGHFAAVSKLNFGVHYGECFAYYEGLLGVNGAGKTTTFRMITGDETISYGNVYGFMKSLEKNRGEFLSNIGYCPQFDGIIGVLSGRQMVQLFYRLRGVPGNNGKAEADMWLQRMGLSESASVQCQKYSGGMKRRLGVAMALIGDPSLLLLDEPTSGVDPVARRQFWEVLRAVRDSGQAIILTSHSMEECEALCSRLGIMVNGQLQCLGGVQHLKSKFAQGYSLSLKLKPLIPANSEELANLRKEIEEKFHPCTLKDIHQNVFQYQLHNTALAWDVVFKTMEELKTTFPTVIEDYSLNETSLEEVFLSFARQQYGARTIRK